jgi:transcription initiation factor TFIIIB Brf1 subunit/transcription initiation factor TFIIB
MKCSECHSNNSIFDEVMGEHTCQECGLVIVTEMFEETVHIIQSDEVIHSSDNGKLGSVIKGQGSYRFNRFANSPTPKHIQQGLMHCNMVLSGLNNSPALKERVEKIYMELNNANLFSKSTYENRASAIVFYALKEQGTPIPLKEVIKEFEVNPKAVKKLLRKINKFYRNQINYTEIDPSIQLEVRVLQITNDLSYLKQCLQVLAKFENIVSNSNLTKSMAYYPSICWITSNIFLRREYNRKVIATKTKIDEKCIYSQTKVLLRLIGKEKVNELKGMNIEKIGETNV